jgi:hypothetical protein
MKTFNQTLTDYFIEKAVNPFAKLCWDGINNCYVITFYFQKEETFNKLNYQIIL